MSPAEFQPCDEARSLLPHEGELRRPAERVKNVFVIGLNDFNRAKLATVSNAHECAFHGLLDEPHDYDVRGRLAEAEAALHAFDGPVDAIVGYIDIPVSVIVAILAARFGVPGPKLESLLKCEHKYWARIEQARVIPEHVPAFAVLDPFDDNALAKLDLDFPFWLKPIKSSGSFLGFRIPDAATFGRAIAEIRAGIGQLGEPFNYVLDQASLPPEIAGIDGNSCIAEAIISGRQCTLEGYVFQGEIELHGVVDSIRVPNRSSFARYEYPSQVPRQVRQRMQSVAERLLRHVGLDNCGFNIEFFWDRRRNRIWLLEVNPRVAQHHSDLFDKVDGISNHEVPVRLALGQPPAMRHRQGAFRHAATFFYRVFHDARVLDVPSKEAIAAVQRRFPGTTVQVQVRPGMWLSELPEQDSYSYALAIVYMGANSRRKLLADWRACADSLRFCLGE